MCPPVVVIGIMAAAAIASATSSVIASQKAKDLANRRARGFTAMGEDAIERGETDAANIQLKGGAQAALVTGAYASGGFKVGEGSALEQTGVTRAIAEHEVRRRRNNAAREARGMKIQAENATDEGQAAAQAGFMSAGVSLLSGAASIASFTSGMGKTTDAPAKGPA